MAPDAYTVDAPTPSSPDWVWGVLGIDPNDMRDWETEEITSFRPTVEAEVYELDPARHLTEGS